MLCPRHMQRNLKPQRKPSEGTPRTWTADMKLAQRDKPTGIAGMLRPPVKKSSADASLFLFFRAWKSPIAIETNNMAAKTAQSARTKLGLDDSLADWPFIIEFDNLSPLDFSTVRMFGGSVRGNYIQSVTKQLLKYETVILN